MKRFIMLSLGAVLVVVFAWVPANAQSVMDKAKEEGK